MARIAGVDIPREKRLEISLTYIFGIGNTLSEQICQAVEVNPSTRVRDLTDEEVARLRTAMAARCAGRAGHRDQADTRGVHHLPVAVRAAARGGHRGGRGAGLDARLLAGTAARLEDLLDERDIRLRPPRASLGVL